MEQLLGIHCQGNTFIDCHRDISFGLIEQNVNDHTGGIIRNNFIIRSSGAGGDVPIAAFDSPGTKIVHNTVLLNGQYPNAIRVPLPERQRAGCGQQPGRRQHLGA